MKNNSSFLNESLLKAAKNNASSMKINEDGMIQPFICLNYILLTEM